MSDTTTIDIVGGALYIDEYRVAGGKPWGGGSVSKSWTVKRSSLKKDLEYVIKCLEQEVVEED